MARIVWHWVSVSAFSFGLSGCVAIQQETGERAVSAPQAGPPAPAVRAFEQALAEFSVLDARGEFRLADCRRLAHAFIEADRESIERGGKPLAEARYDAGLSYQRCGLDSEARALFESALSVDSRHGPSRTEVALADFARTGAVDDAITTLEDVVQSSHFLDTSALVKLAALRLQRHHVRPNDAELEAAQKDIQRALAIDDRFMPAYNQLALFHLHRARRALGKGSEPSMSLASEVESGERTQALDMAALVAAHGLEKNPRYAPLHNTAGLIAVELGELHRAIESFDRARTLAPALLEASHNYAAVSLLTRSFERAEIAYRATLARSPKDYEALVGLSLSLRGQAKGPTDEALLTAAEQALDRATALAPERPEAYFNRALLTSEFRAKSTEGTTAVTMLKRAHCELGRFVQRARNKPGYETALKRAEARRRDISDTLLFIREPDSSASDSLPEPPLPPLECG
jgi:tetratricopeptide (TPR) repeat protein